eukprot:8887549-Alexandrium_andersonii.AAC.1
MQDRTLPGRTGAATQIHTRGPGGLESSGRSRCSPWGYHSATILRKASRMHEAKDRRERFAAEVDEEWGKRQ